MTTPPERAATLLFYEDLEPGRPLGPAAVLLSPDRVEEYRRLVEGSAARNDDTDVPTPLLLALALERALGAGGVSASLDALKGVEVALSAPVNPGEALTLTGIVAHRCLEEDAARGVVGLRIELHNATGETLLEGAVTAVVRTRSREAAELLERQRPSFASPQWLSALAERVSGSPEFAEAAAPFDGSIGLDFGVGLVGLRIYRGRIIDQGRSIARAATFTLGAAPETWLRFAAQPRNEFISFAMSNAFDVRGSTYEYLRLTKALVILTDEVRRLLRAGDGSEPSALE